MKYDDICSVVTQRADVQRPRADSVVKAALQALSEQADRQAFEGMLGQLPSEFAKAPDPEIRDQHRSLDEFLTRVAALEDTTASEVGRPVLAVFAALSAAVSSDALEATVKPLGEQFEALLPPPRELLEEQAFLERVRQRGGMVTTDEAQSVARATLGVLADRVTGAQARDLATFLPSALSPWLEPNREKAHPFDRSEFLGRIAADRYTAESQARAVLATVREAAPEREIQDTLAQLPIELARLFTS